MLTFIFVSKYLHFMAATARRDVFQAIADPTRREIIQLVAKRPLNLNAIAENFDMSRPAISQHIKVLTECGLIVVHQKGRERFCEAQLQQLTEVASWVNQYQAFWNAKLYALEQFLDNNKPENTQL